MNSEACSHPVTHAQLRELAAVLSKNAGGPDYVGKNWTEYYLHRHPHLQTKIGRKIDRNRINNVTPEALKGWFDSLQKMKHKLKIQDNDIYNMDETGIALSAYNNTIVISSTQSRSTFKKTPEDREWVSIIETISATGVKLPPVVIFKGKGIQSSWYTEEGIPNFLYTTSENG